MPGALSRSINSRVNRRGTGVPPVFPVFEWPTTGETPVP
jgi:hypothetical protein